MSMFNESLERTYLELVTLWVKAKRESNDERDFLLWETIENLRRIWPEKINEIEARHRSPAA